MQIVVYRTLFDLKIIDSLKYFSMVYGPLFVVTGFGIIIMEQAFFAKNLLQMFIQLEKLLDELINLLEVMV